MKTFASDISSYTSYVLFVRFQVGKLKGAKINLQTKLTAVEYIEVLQ